MSLKCDINMETNSKGGLSSDYVKKWEQRSSIRSRPGKYIDFSLSGFFFPEEKQPVLLDPSLKDLDNNKKTMLLVQSFFKYLNDIINIEIKLINAACSKIIYNDMSVKYDEQIKINAYTVIIDEYYHVYIARNMVNQLRNHYPKLALMNYPVSDAYSAMSIVLSKLMPEYHDLFEIIAVCIFETTLVRDLVEFFNSNDVHPSIKYYVKDHMNDESRHYIFFLELLQYTWSRMSDDEIEAIGENMANFVKLYLNFESEKLFNIDLLTNLNNNHQKSKSSIDKIYSGFEVTPEVPIVKNVLSALKRTGILNSPVVRRGFENIGWFI